MTAAIVKKPRRPYVGKKANDGRPLATVSSVISETLGWSKNGLMIFAGEEGAREAIRLVEMGFSVEEAVQRARFAHTKRRDAAGNAGKLAHAMAEYFLAGQDPELAIDEFEDEETVAKARVCFDKFAKWWPTSGYRVRLTEHVMMDVITGFAGTCDYVLEHVATGDLVVADLKTGKRAYDETTIQLGGYSLLLAKDGIHVKRGLVIHCPFDGELDPIDVPEVMLVNAAGYFMHLLAVHRGRHNIKIEKPRE